MDEYDFSWGFEKPSYNDRCGTFLTNFSRYQLPIYQKAIRQYNQTYDDKKFWIREDAYASDGRLINDSYALHVQKIDGFLDCSSFWRIFDKISCQYPSFLSRVNPRKPVTFKQWLVNQQPSFENVEFPMVNRVFS